MNSEQRYLQQCIDRAVESVATGGGPFAAMIVRRDRILAMADNRVTANNDPTAHAEVNALRQAGAAAGRPHLPDCVLYASCEPCPMCLAAAMWARVSRIVFAAPHTEAVRAGFADTGIARSLYGQPWPVDLEPGFFEHQQLPGASAPFEAWLAKSDRIEY